MKDHAAHIRNPLTVISIFAGIAEISGTVVLPFISAENQATYIWFLMLFPVLLVIAFFLTLNFNHKTLYAPSDYQNQNHFLSLFGIVTPDERDEKLNDELIEVITEKTQTIENPSDKQDPETDQATSANQTETTPSQNMTLKEDDGAYNITPTTHPRKHEVTLEAETTKEHDENFNFEEFAAKTQLESKTRLRAIENASIAKVKALTKINFSKRVKFDIPNLDQPLIFDAIADEDDAVHIVEIKYFDETPFTVTRFNSTLSNANIAANNVYRVSNKKVVLHLVVVLNPAGSGRYAHNISVALKNASKTYDYRVSVYVFNEEDLAINPKLGPWVFRNS